MSNFLYTVNGCARCAITKRFLKEQGIAYTECDSMGAGRVEFARFYRENRAAIFRDKDGVEFPVFFDGKAVRQGAGAVIGGLLAGGGLDGFIGRSPLHGEWVGGFDVSEGDPVQAENFMAVLQFLKSSRLKIELTTNGRNAAILEQLAAAGLGDRVIMEVQVAAGPLRREIDPIELRRSIRAAAGFGAYLFFTPIAPVERADGRIDYPTPDEIGETARLIGEATGSNRNPFQLRPFDPRKSNDPRFKTVEALPPAAMYKYRTAARRHQLAAEIAKA